MCLPSGTLLQHLPSSLGFSYLVHGVSLHGCSSKAQPLLLPLDEGYLLTAALRDLQCEMAPVHPPAPRNHCSLEVGWLLPAAAPGLGHRAAPLGHCILALSATAPDLRRGTAPLGGAYCASRSRLRLVHRSQQPAAP